uniref:Uncharacterized protein n=1 Tax=Setaria italica TaxID=4555 RepID=K3Z1M4_SETIT
MEGPRRKDQRRPAFVGQKKKVVKVAAFISTGLTGTAKSLRRKVACQVSQNEWQRHEGRISWSHTAGKYLRSGMAR